MVQAAAAATTMTLVVAEKDHQPVFRDFLGLDRGVTKQQQQQLEYTTTTSGVVAGRSSRSSAGFESEEGDEDVETFATRTTAAAASSGTSGRFEASSNVPQGYYVSPPFALAIPSSSSDPGSGERESSLFFFLCCALLRPRPSGNSNICRLTSLFRFVLFQLAGRDVAPPAPPSSNTMMVPGAPSASQISTTGKLPVIIRGTTPVLESLCRSACK
jgi:hypothetical protein